MDIEKTKRINALAKELVEHGMASNYEEAYSQAEKTILKNDEIWRGNSEQTSHIPVHHEPQQSNPVTFTLDIKRLEARMDAIEQQVSQAFLKMNEIINEINKIQKKTPQPLEIKSEPEPHKELQATFKETKTEPHPRSGGYKSDDVSIEKMFYFGGGRR